jgi:hypothetical protein
MHVEDHPLDSYDFEGIIAAGEYGAGDVVLWDWGTWALAEGDDPMAEIAGAGCTSRCTARSCGAASPSSAPATVAAATSGCCSSSTTTTQCPAGTRGLAPFGEVRSHNDEVRDASAAGWTGRADWAAPTDDEHELADRLRRPARPAEQRDRR